MTKFISTDYAKWLINTTLLLTSNVVWEEGAEGVSENLRHKCEGLK
jgi:hypothetical protein